MGHTDNVLKSLPYSNCRVYSPDGVLMFRSTEKRARWYLDRDLADIISEDPLSIKLRFDPAGLGWARHEHKYGLDEFFNRCVVCGSEELLTKHHVVPYCYRRWMPIEFKAHNFHDILLLCKDCHSEYEKHAYKLKQELGERFNDSLNPQVDKSDLLTIKKRKLANTFIKGITTESIPYYRLEEILTELEFISCKTLSFQEITELAYTKDDIVKTEVGKNTIEFVLANNQLHEFSVMWRKHFLQHCRPKFLPTNWSVDHEPVLFQTH